LDDYWLELDGDFSAESRDNALIKIAERYGLTVGAMFQALSREVTRHNTNRRNRIDELVNALKGDVDETDMKSQGITAEEWREQVELELAKERNNKLPSPLLPGNPANKT
jgi:hypothetical protein